MIVRLALLILLGALAVPAVVFAETSGPELHISSRGEVHIIGAEITSKHALNLFTVNVWGQKWTVPIDRYTSVMAADGSALAVKEIELGHRLEVKGRPMPNQLGWLDTRSVRDLSIRPPASPGRNGAAGSRAEPPAGQAAVVAAIEPPPPFTPPLQPAAIPPPTPSTPPRRLSQTLKFGMRGAEVAMLQEFLQRHNWGIPSDGPVTGYFGKVTAQAVARFQSANGLPPEGEVGPKTRALLNQFFEKGR